MVVLYFNHTSIVGGASWCLLEMIQNLDRNRFDPVVVLRQEGPLADELKRLNIRVIIEPGFSIISERYPVKFPFYLLKSFSFMVSQCFHALISNRAIRRICEEVQPDIVHLNSCVLFPMALPASKSSSSPKVILHIREHWVSYWWAPVREWMKTVFLNRYINEVLSITHTGATCFGVASRAMIVRDWPDFKTRSDHFDVKLELGLDKEIPMFLVPGGLHPSKGTIVALKAFKKLPKTHKAALVVLGVPHNSNNINLRLKQFFFRLGFRVSSICIHQEAIGEDFIYLMGFTQNIKSLISSSVAVVCPFTVPHAAKAALEAGLLERPSIVSDNGEGREYVSHETTGMVVPAGDVDALSEAMQFILKNPEEGKRMGANARDFVRESFSENKSLQLIDRMYLKNTR